MSELDLLVMLPPETFGHLALSMIFPVDVDMYVSDETPEH